MIDVADFIGKPWPVNEVFYAATVSNADLLLRDYATDNTDYVLN
jgi:hypothetical protein